MNSIIEKLNWRYATKAFDETKKVSQDDLNTIMEAFRLTASSFGLQPWKLVVVENQELQDQLVEHSWGQTQVANCSHLLVLTKPSNFGDKNIEEYIADIMNTRGGTKEELAGYEKMMKGFLSNMTTEQIDIWMIKQVYIALGNLLTVCAQMDIDSCPIEGFIADKYDQVLGLEKKGLSSVVILPIGYRSTDDKYSELKKVRFSQEKIIERI
ncbi:MAG: NAD(P)H-dependent oxidoreductase [Candidatus Gracilibacteria bacterium]|nr:NAD(P)H-dependent oxidoreductase [Candidatus Gracilibacteria bacterium]